jgi:hypothetical protein
MPVTPRSVSGGSSLSRYLVTGQFRPQPIDVVARKNRPAGVIRDAGDAVDEAVLKNQNRESRRPPCLLLRHPTIVKPA